MSSKQVALRTVGALAALAVLMSGCANDEPTTTTEEIQKAAVFQDADIFSALLASNYAISQVATNATADFNTATDGGLVVDPGAVTLATQQKTDADAALTRLYGTADINPTDGSTVTPGGLASTLGVTAGSDSYTDAVNAQATTDAATVAASATPDLDYANVALAQDQKLLDLISSALDPTNTGFHLQSDALRTELTTEQTTLQTDLAAAQAEIDALSPDAGAASSP